MSYTGNEKIDVYQIITNRIIDLLEKGVTPWQKPWKSNSLYNTPLNLISKREYRGVNVFLLSSQGYISPFWLTFNQVKEKGGHVKKGEKGTPVVFWKVFKKEVENPETHQKEEKKIFVLRYYTVFNTEQCEGLNVPNYKIENNDTPEQRIEKAEKIYENMPNRPVIGHKGNRAFYRPSDDLVMLPEFNNFRTPEEYYCTQFHEISHSTGHKSRLNRKGVSEQHFFGDKEYSKEELVAEMSAAFLCSYCGIENKTINNSASYLQNWINTLKGDKKLVVVAASQAQKSANYILGVKPEKTEDEEVDTDNID